MTGRKLKCPHSFSSATLCHLAKTILLRWVRNVSSWKYTSVVRFLGGHLYELTPLCPLISHIQRYWKITIYVSTSRKSLMPKRKQPAGHAHMVAHMTSNSKGLFYYLNSPCKIQIARNGTRNKLLGDVSHLVHDDLPDPKGPPLCNNPKTSHCIS